MNKCRALVAVFLAVFSSSAASQVPYVFTPGTAAKASEVNDNFAALSAQIAGKVSADQALGHGQNPTITGFTFWAPTASVAIASPSQKVLVISMKVVGCAGPVDSGYWSVNICFRNVNDPASLSNGNLAIAYHANPTNPDWTPYFIIPAGMYYPISLSAILPSLPAGTYEVGLCGAPVGFPTTNKLQWYANGGSGNGYTQVVSLN